MTISVLSVASEAVPLVKTGGLADVVGALPEALASHGVKMTTLLPGYPQVLDGVTKARTVHRYESLLGESARVLSGKLDDGRAMLVLDAPAFFSRHGSLYVDGHGKDWPDNWRRFSALGKAAADLAANAPKSRKVDIVHAHDWQAAMAPAYLRYEGKQLPSVLTIHNMAFQGWYGRDIFPRLEMPASAWTMDGVEFHGGVGMLKAGLVSASAITTVSPSYAQEIHTAEFGMGLDGVIRSRTHLVHGILNGIDAGEWSPRHDAALPANYSTSTLDKRKANKRALEEEFGLESHDGPLFIVVSRLTWQKGMDVLLEVIDHLIGIGGRLAVLGSGDKELEAGLLEAAARHPGKLGVKLGYDEALAHRLQGGGDAILIPSRFEPCGLTQLYGLAYGCVPVVARTGGLGDTIIDANPAALAQGVATGVTFCGVSYDHLSLAITRTVALFHRNEEWRRLQLNGMKADFSWAKSGAVYAALYRQLAGQKA